jgi:guanylate kinase
LSERHPNVIVVSAPSGAGKSTVLGRILEELPDIRFSVSHTTRKPREGENDGVHYHFVSKKAFEEMKAAGRMLEWAHVHDHLYGTSHAEYERARAEGVDLLLDVDVQGAAQVRVKIRDAVTVFILPPSFDALKRRLRGRGSESDALIERRLKVATEEASLYGEYEYILVNDDLDRCVESLKSVIRSARLRTSRMGGEAARILESFPKK